VQSAHTLYNNLLKDNRFHRQDRDPSRPSRPFDALPLDAQFLMNECGARILLARGMLTAARQKILDLLEDISNPQYEKRGLTFTARTRVEMKLVKTLLTKFELDNENRLKWANRYQELSQQLELPHDIRETITGEHLLLEHQP